MSSELGKSSQWRVESRRNNCVGYFNFSSVTSIKWWWYFSPLKSDPCILQSVAPCLWTKFAHFSKKWKWLIWNWIQVNSYRYERRLVSISDWPEIAYFVKLSISDWPEIAYFVKLISNIFLLVDRGHDLRHGIWNGPVCLVCWCIILSEFTQKVEDWNWKNCRICNVLRCFIRISKRQHNPWLSVYTFICIKCEPQTFKSKRLVGGGNGWKFHLFH